mgnify:CR=1 FL=1
MMSGNPDDGELAELRQGVIRWLRAGAAWLGADASTALRALQALRALRALRALQRAKPHKKTGCSYENT